jgi:hypothetical protein
MISCIDLISFTLHNVFSLFVYNQCSDLELTSPEYFGSDVIWHILPDEKVDTGAMARAGFGVDEIKYDSMPALIYSLQRKYLESNTEDTSTNIQLLVMWEPRTRHGFFMRALLVENSNTMTWDEDKLRELCSKHLALLRDDVIVRNIHLLDGTIVLMATPNESGLSRITEITISKGSEDNFMISLSL